MKYLLPIDVPDEMGDKIRAFYVTVYNGFETKQIKMDRKLIPMPLKRKTEVVWHDANGRELITHEYTEKDKVWNEIVDYLEGEDNE